MSEMRVDWTIRDAGRPVCVWKLTSGWDEVRRKWEGREWTGVSGMRVHWSGWDDGHECVERRWTRVSGMRVNRSGQDEARLECV